MKKNNPRHFNRRSLRYFVKSFMYTNSADLNTRTASSLFSIDCLDVTKEHKERAAVFNLGRFSNSSVYNLGVVNFE